MTQQALNTCIETGGNIAPDQINPQPQARRQPDNFAQYEDEDYHEEPAYHPQPVPQGQLHQNIRAGLMRQMAGQVANLEFTEEETQYYNYKTEKGTYRLTPEKGTGVLSGIGSAFSGIKGFCNLNFM